MELPITDAIMTTNGHGFSFRKRDGASVAFEFDSSEAAERARAQVASVITAAKSVTIQGS